MLHGALEPPRGWRWVFVIGGAVLQWLFSRVYLKIVQVPKAILVPNILVLCVIGAYALKLGLPLATLILGVILGDQIEINLVRALMTDNDTMLFLTRPISGAMLVMAVGSVAFAVWQHERQYRRGRAAVPDEPDTDF